MAALRNSVGTVIIPADNVKDLEEIDQTVRGMLNFVPVRQVDEVLLQALTSTLPVTLASTARKPPEVPRTVGHGVNLRH